MVKIRFDILNNNNNKNKIINKVDIGTDILKVSINMIISIIQLSTLFLLFFFLTPKVEAHCPLCTIGIATVAGGATLLGVKTSTIGLFVGALAISTSFWFANMKNLKLYKRYIIVLISYLLTILPLTQIFPESFPVYVSIAGDYGSPFNRTYLINSFLLGSLIGAIIVSVSPKLSEKLTEIRRKKMLFQGVIITLSILILMALILQYM